MVAAGMRTERNLNFCYILHAFGETWHWGWMADMVALSGSLCAGVKMV